MVNMVLVNFGLILTRPMGREMESSILERVMKFETINKKVTYALHSKGGVKETTPKNKS